MTLRAFLDSRRVAKDDAWNLTGMGKDAGKYYVSNSDYDELLQLHHDHVFVHKKPSSLLEKHGEYTPLLIDLDFRYAVHSIDREFTKDDVRAFVKAYADAFFHFIDHKDSIRFFVEVKPMPIVEKDVKKDGIHIICPDINVDYTIPFTLRKYLLEQGALSCFTGFTNTCEDCFDESVIKRNNWFLHGATKPDKEQYSVVYCFIADPDGGFDETEWDESNRDFTSLFSLRHKRDSPTPLTIRPDMLDEWNMWESLVDKKPTQVAPIPAIQDNASVASHLSAGISKILNFNGCLWEVSEQADGYKLTHNSKACLVESGYMHSDLNHSCIFVQPSHATMSCLSHKSKRVPKGRSEKLWNLLAGEEDDGSMAMYTIKKATFEECNFRVLNPPGYMTRIDDSWVHYTRQQLIDMNSGIFLDDAKKERFIDWWLRDADIRTYSRIGYFVDKSECPTSVFNTFHGFDGSRVSSDGSINLLLYHIRTVISNDCEDVYEFILDWLASCIQCPRRLTGLCLVIMGQHGSGKDIIFNWFGSKVVGMDAYFKTARPHIDMFGAFNASRINRVFYHIEEGNRNSMTSEYIEQFKNCVTDEFAAVQLKGKDTRDNVINYNHFVITTNNSVPFDIHNEERRFFAVRANPLHVRDAAYFDRLDKECLRVPGVARAFYDFLMGRNITGRDWKNPPATEALKEWKHACESVIVQFIEHFRAMNPEVVEILSSELYIAYKSYCRDFKSDIMTLRAFGMEVKKVIGESNHTRTGKVYTFEKKV